MQSDTFQSWQYGIVKAAGKKDAIQAGQRTSKALMEAYRNSTMRDLRKAELMQGLKTGGKASALLAALGLTGYAGNELVNGGGDGLAAAAAEAVDSGAVNPEALGDADSKSVLSAVADMLMSKGTGTAIRGAGGAGAGYLLGKYLGDHGAIGATLGGAAGLTPEIMEYAPQAVDAIKGLFSGK